MDHTDFLNQIRIAKPCPANWDEMTGDDRARFCAHCQKHVYNLSAMTAAAAVALVREKEGQMCARFFQRRDGTMLTADCPVGVALARRVYARVAMAVAAGLTVLLTTAFGRRPAELKRILSPEPTAIAGGITAPPLRPAPRCAPIMGDVAAPMGEVNGPLMGKPALPVRD